jgi:uncharacterized membrane protein YtjA (UPF0391 family)
MPLGLRAHVGTVLQQPGAPAYNWDEGAYVKVATHFPLNLERLGEIKEMLHYAVVFFIIAIIAAVLGFGGIAAGAAGIAKVLFFVFLVLALITFLRRA